MSASPPYNSTNSDVAWSIVFSREDRRTLAALSLVSKRFLRLTTTEELFRVHSVQLIGLPGALASRSRSRSWRRVYRNVRALASSSRISAHEYSVSHSGQLHLLWSCSLTHCAVFFETSHKELIGWKSKWRLNPASLPFSVRNVRSAIVSIGPGILGVFDGETSTPTLSVVDGESGIILAKNRLELGCPMCTTWTAAAVHNSPWGLRAGSAGDCIIVCSLREILCLEWLSGNVLRRWQREGEKDVFSFFVRGQGNEYIVGYINIIGEVCLVHDICNDELLAEFCVGAGERVVDVAMSENLSIIAVRVFSLGRIICVVYTSASEKLFNADFRIVLQSDSELPQATKELLVQDTTVVYKPEMSRSFPGPITVITREQGGSFCSLRCVGSNFSCALLTSDARNLVTASHNGVQVYRLSSGDCIVSHRIDGDVAGLFLCGIDTHAIGVVSTKSFRVIHFSAFCGPLEYPLCCS